MKDMSKGSLLLSLLLGAVYVGIEFSIDLVVFGYFILILALFLIIHYFQASLVHWHGEEVSKNTEIAGLVGMVLLALFFGIQSPQIHSKYVLALVFVFVLIAIWGGKNE